MSEATSGSSAAQVEQQPTNTLVAASQPPRALTVYDRIRDPMDFIKNIGTVLYESKMFGCANVAQGRALALGFLANRLDPFSWKARHHIIGGNITMSAEAMLADFRIKAGGKHRIVARTPDRVAVELQCGREKQLFEFTWQEAVHEDYVWTKAAAEDPKLRVLPDGRLNVQLLKDNYSTPRRRMQMLWARLISDGVGAMTPEVPAGQQTPEELGVLGSEIEGEIIDAEWEIKKVEPEPSHAAAGQQDGQASSQPAAPDTPAAPSTVSKEDAAPAVQYKAEPASVAPPTAAQVESRRQQLSDERHGLLTDLKAAKDQLMIPQDRWQGILAKRNVSSARDLDDAQLADLVSALQRKLEERLVQQGKDPVSQWANNALEGRAGN